MTYLEKSFPPIKSGNEITKDDLDTSILPQVPSSDELKYKLQVSKTQLHLLLGSLKSGAKDIEGLLSLDPQNPISHVLEANLLYKEGKFDKAIQNLLQCQIDPKDLSLLILFYNDLGCIHHYLGKFTAAEYYYVKALEYNNQLYTNKKYLHPFSYDKMNVIMFNRGVSLLLNGKPDLAFQCFMDTLPYYYNSYMIWLRLGECCISHYLIDRHEKGYRQPNQSSYQYVLSTHQIVRHTMKTGEATKIYIGTSPNEKIETTNMSITFEKIGLVYGLKYFQNVLILLKKEELQSRNNNETNQNTNRLEESKSKERLLLRLSALVSMAWIDLEMFDPVSAYHHSSFAITISDEQYDEKQKTKTLVLKYLAHVYHAEACIRLRNFDLAIESLHRYIQPNEGFSGIIEYLLYTGGYPENGKRFKSTQDNNKLKETESITRSNLLVNMAIISILKGDFDKAKAYVDKVLQSTLHYPAALLLVYIELRKENPDKALEILSSNPLKRPFPKLKI